MGGGRLKVEKILKTQQPEIHKQLNKNRKQNKKKSRRGKKEENLSFSDVMNHDSYCRGKGGRIKQRIWGK
ncbi:hypothetical protein FDC22_11660 [Clostridium botulinum]|uniref:Uncharacterized protein n=1 Tax=Clostridium botulinum (strain Okra / Type B1) TaxID=498213 RepID=B1ILS1_CLOBK|nr:hypothetical protein [Clostridium botulinum]EKX78743.1 hypothetical protein CFSAN001628_017364 [Clostridium botulinum CFSAN001628]ACA45362.1 hypothetical protein CLD_2905 [Clostridium botulinum B1 str. Okra]MBD5562415.1 hypothetical protein [Clostridium botulinum]MBD5566150.1 hypothetical protein [Clostridium botulinum]MBD5569334.1 hypothetical protein [Clostridium botulinum]